MPQTLETPADFPGMEDVSKGDKKKFLVEVECTNKEDDGEMDWEVLSIDGVKEKPDDDEDTEDSEDDGIDDSYDDSQDEGGDEDMSPSGKPKTTKGIGMLIVSGKPK